MQGILSNGTIIAVKMLSSRSKQGNREFINEIGLISALEHPCLIKLYGCCVEGDQLLLVYEYMENNSLAQALFGSGEFRLKLDWPKRHKICLSIARDVLNHVLSLLYVGMHQISRFGLDDTVKIFHRLLHMGMGQPTSNRTHDWEDVLICIEVSQVTDTGSSKRFDLQIKKVDALSQNLVRETSVLNNKEDTLRSEEANKANLVKNIEELKHSGKEKSSAVKKAEEGAADLKKKVDELTKSLEEHDKEYQVKA
ncbi:hypothetical protein AAZX31_01G047700 [Glycine max]